MNGFDLTVLRFINSFAGHSQVADSLIGHSSENLLFCGGVMMTLFWCAWMKEEPPLVERRQTLIFGLAASVFSLFVARVLALSLPFRERPLANPLLGVRIPHGFDPTTLIDWSSFPSDHAALFFCLAVTLWMVSRRLGLIAVCHALFVASLPRVYTGVHYPTDILAGAVLGCGVALLARNNRLRHAIAQPALEFLQLHPNAFYAGLFLWTFETAELFNTVRALLHPGLQAIKIALHVFHTIA